MKSVNLKFGCNTFINLVILAFHIFGVWPRKHSTVIHTVIRYSIRELFSAGWTITKSFSTTMLADPIDLMLLGSSVRCYCTDRTFIRIFKIWFKFENLKKSNRDTGCKQRNIKTFFAKSVLYVVFVFSAIELSDVVPYMCGIGATNLLTSVY